MSGATFDNTVRIPIEGAMEFPFTSATDYGPPDWNADLAVTHLEVDLHCREVGLVTLAATNDQAWINALGVEFDLQPEAARLLATRLLAAADAADGGEASPTANTDYGPPDWNADLAVTHLEVDLHCREVGLVTLAATNDQAWINALGVEFDLQPEAARLLATRLLAAADAADGGEASPTANGVPS